MKTNFWLFFFNPTLTKLGCTYPSSHLGKRQLLVLEKERTNYNDGQTKPNREVVLLELLLRIANVR